MILAKTVTIGLDCRLHTAVSPILQTLQGCAVLDHSHSADTPESGSKSNLVQRTLSPVQVRHRLNAAAGYLILGMADHALRELQEFPPDADVAVLSLRGEAFREQKRHVEALEVFERLIGQEPTDLSAAIGKAWCLKRLGRIEAAIVALQEASVWHPREAIIQYNLACYYALDSKKPLCLSHLGVALRLDAAFVELIDEESDFDSLRADPDFVQLIETVARVA